MFQQNNHPGFMWQYSAVFSQYLYVNTVFKLIPHINSYHIGYCLYMLNSLIADNVLQLSPACSLFYSPSV